MTTESDTFSPLYASNDLDGIAKKFTSEHILACVWKASDVTQPRTPFTSWHNKIRCCPWTLGMLPQTIVNFQPPHSYYSEDSDTKLIEGGLTFQTNASPHMDTKRKRSRTTPYPTIPWYGLWKMFSSSDLLCRGLFNDFEFPATKVIPNVSQYPISDLGT